MPHGLWAQIEARQLQAKLHKRWLMNHQHLQETWDRAFPKYLQREQKPASILTSDPLAVSGMVWTVTCVVVAAQFVVCCHGSPRNLRRMPRHLGVLGHGQGTESEPLQRRGSVYQQAGSAFVLLGEGMTVIASKLATRPNWKLTGILYFQGKYK